MHVLFVLFNFVIPLAHFEGGRNCCQPAHPLYAWFCVCMLVFPMPERFSTESNLTSSSEAHLEEQGRLQSAAPSADVGDQSCLWLYFHSCAFV